MSETNWTAITIVALVLLGWISFSKPACSSGMTPVFTVVSGWYCAPGYKPD